jgi:hypothetical protein
MSDWLLEQRIDIKFCVKLGRNASDTCAMLSKDNGGKAMKNSHVFEWHEGSKSQMKTILLTFFVIKATFHF